MRLIGRGLLGGGPVAVVVAGAEREADGVDVDARAFVTRHAFDDQAGSLARVPADVGGMVLAAGADGDLSRGTFHGGQRFEQPCEAVPYALGFPHERALEPDCGFPPLRDCRIRQSDAPSHTYPAVFHLRFLWMPPVWTGLGGTARSYYWSGYRPEGDMVVKYRCRGQRFFDGHPDFYS